ncbi:MAG: KH domain-containing protein [Candidatus Bathyarchaeia archaeon]
MSTYIKIPNERIGVLVGHDGEVKRMIEEKGDVILRIDSDTGEAEVSPRPDADLIRSLRGINVVKAIGRGFSARRAFRLFDEGEAMYEVIDLRQLLGKSRSQQERVKGRIIGKGGKIRALIEELTGTYVSVYGHTIGLIGDPEQIRMSKEAIFMLIKGCSHRTLLRFLFKKRRELKRRRVMEIWEE